MVDIAKLLEQIHAIISSNAKVYASISPFKCTIPADSTPEHTFEKIMDMASIFDHNVREKHKKQIVTILQQLDAEKKEAIQKTQLNKDQFEALFVDLAITKNINGTVELRGIVAVVEVDLSDEWFWRQWKMREITSYVSESYKDVKKSIIK